MDEPLIRSLLLSCGRIQLVSFPEGILGIALILVARAQTNMTYPGLHVYADVTPKMTMGRLLLYRLQLNQPRQTVV